jgi:hypothetical protein
MEMGIRIPLGAHNFFFAWNLKLMRQEGKACRFIFLVFVCYLTSHKILRSFKKDFREFPERRNKETATYFIFVCVWKEKNEK